MIQQLIQQFHSWADVQRNTWFERTHAMCPMFIAALFTVAKMWKQPKCPSMDEWMKKMWYIHRMEYYSAIKKRKKFCNMLPYG